MEDSALRGEGLLDDAFDGVDDESGLEAEIGVGAAVKLPASGTSRFSRGKVDDVESEALCDTLPSNVEGVDERMTLVVLEHASSALGTLPDPEHTPDTPSPGATPWPYRVILL